MEQGTSSPPITFLALMSYRVFMATILDPPSLAPRSAFTHHEGFCCGAAMLRSRQSKRRQGSPMTATTSDRPRRSALYMPASNAKAVEKARTLDADVIILDLEDAVAPEMQAGGARGRRGGGQGRRLRRA
jgi:hypothetical protein